MTGNLFGDYIRQRREDAWLTRTDLAKRANLSVSLIEKIELGARPPTLHALQILFDELDVAPMYRRHILEHSLPELYGTPTTPRPRLPDTHDLADLETLIGPACLYTLPTFTILAANAAHRHSFPGLHPGMSFIEWMFLTPAARDIMVDWHNEASRLIHSLRMLTPNLTTNPTTAAIIENCSRTTEWNDLWPGRPHHTPGDARLALRDLHRRRTRTVQIRLYSPEYPNRHWWLCRLIPESLPTRIPDSQSSSM
ncbi:helix-turn-helix domain-containing protein [Nocardia heshunensis]